MSSETKDNGRRSSGWDQLRADHEQILKDAQEKAECQLQVALHKVIEAGTHLDIHREHMMRWKQSNPTSSPPESHQETLKRLLGELAENQAKQEQLQADFNLIMNELANDSLKMRTEAKVGADYAREQERQIQTEDEYYRMQRDLSLYATRTREYRRRRKSKKNIFKKAQKLLPFRNKK